MELAYPFHLRCEEGEYIVSFPDIPEALTGAATEEEAIALASDALIAALGGYMEDKREIPEPSPLQTGQEMGYLRPLEAAKIALYIAMQKEGLSNIGLANRFSVDEKSVRRMLDLDHHTKIETIHKALRSVFSDRYDLVTSLQTKGKTKTPENREGNLSSLHL
jgi:antitoxin HicB